MKRTVVDRWVGVALMAAAGIWSWLVLTTIAGGGLDGAPGPRAFPLLLGELLGLLGLVMVATSFASVAGQHEAQRVEPVRRDEIVFVGGGFLLFLLYAFLMEKIGFLLATPIISILALRLILGIRKWLRILLVSAGLTLGCYVVFGVLMQAHLPHGTWVRISED